MQHLKVSLYGRCVPGNPRTLLQNYKVISSRSSVGILLLLAWELLKEFSEISSRSSSRIPSGVSQEFVEEIFRNPIRVPWELLQEFRGNFSRRSPLIPRRVPSFYRNALGISLAVSGRFLQDFSEFPGKSSRSVS